jgi:alpha-amylase
LASFFALERRFTVGIFFRNRRCHRTFQCRMKRLILLIVGLLAAFSASANPWNGKVVLQAFWWDYWNNNYPNNWATYLADLAPRLREMGIDAVWIPPTVKNKNATGSVGYAPFDHYDLGDKFQGGGAGTRFGTKDNYLRAVAILHANGIDVIQDMVWNHLDDAGSDTGEGGLDPAAPSNQYKNFRYASFATPATSNDAANYGARRGRFPKNWQNFHPNPDHNTEGDDITAGFFGPDICYYSQARGLSSNSSYNPAQGVDYMRNGVRDWSIWLKKQTGVDGFRLDAAKHFEIWATQDFLWNLAFNAGFASGGNHMYAVGEFVGSAAEMDAWVDAANAANGGNVDLVGTFDFSLRGAIKSMVDSSGFFNLAGIPGAQQNRRTRTAPFVNNHDTFRPQLDANGRYTGWNSGSELGGHIDPNDARIQAAYAMAFAVDGSPQIFFEDLFDLHSTGKRWTHSPTNTADLPARSWLTNQIWCHQKLNFKDGAYKVRSQAADLLVIERGARALIGINDNFNAAQSANVQTDFGPNVLLRDYSGANPNDQSTDASGRFTITVPPCDGTNLRRGYCIWGPAGITGGFSHAIRSVTQEWEMSDDLGDSHPSSLRQGGALPSNSTGFRTAGRFYPAAATTVSIDGFSSNPSPAWTISILDSASNQITNSTGADHLSLVFTPSKADLYTIRIQNAANTNPTQTVWIKTTYTAPRNRFSTQPVFSGVLRDIYTVAGAQTLIQNPATGNPAPNYQWLKSGVEIPNATNSFLTVTNATSGNAGSYSLRAWNEAGIANTAPFTLTVYPDATPTITNATWTAPSTVSFQTAAPAGLNYIVQTSTNLVAWTSIKTNTAPFTFSDSTPDSARFYRLQYVP